MSRELTIQDKEYLEFAKKKVAEAKEEYERYNGIIKLLLGHSEDEATLNGKPEPQNTNGHSIQLESEPILVKRKPGRPKKTVTPHDSTPLRQALGFGFPNFLKVLFEDGRPRTTHEIRKEFIKQTSRDIAVAHFSSKLNTVRTRKEGRIDNVGYKQLPLERRYWWGMAEWKEGDDFKKEYRNNIPDLQGVPFPTVVRLNHK